MEAYAKYIIAIAKLSEDAASLEAVKQKLNELLDAQLDAVLTVLEAKSKDWGDVARSVNRTMAEVRKDVVEAKLK